MTRLRPLILVLWLAGLTRAVGQSLPDSVPSAIANPATAPGSPNGTQGLPTRAASVNPLNPPGTVPLAPGATRQPLPDAVPGILPHATPALTAQPMPLGVYTPSNLPSVTQDSVDGGSGQFPHYAPANQPPAGLQPYTMPAVPNAAQPAQPVGPQQDLQGVPGTAPMPSLAPIGPGPSSPLFPAPGMGGACPTTPMCSPPPPPMQVTGILGCPEKVPMAWIQYDTLLWWIKNAPNTPPTVSTGPLTANNPTVLSDPTTQILYGGHSINFADFVGGRLTAGMWLTYDQQVGIEGSGFLLEHKVAGFNASSDSNGNPALSRPFFNTLTGQEDVTAVSLPGAQIGNIQVASTTGLGGMEVNFFAPLMKQGCWQIQGRVGARYLNLSDNLKITDTTGIAAPLEGVGFLYLNGSPTVGYPNVLTVVDSYRTVNNFYGGQAGFTTLWTFDRLSIKAQGQIAVGEMNEILDIFGSTTEFASFGSSKVLATYPGGIFAVPSNSGNFSRDRLGVVPSFDLTAIYQLFPNIAVQVGYNFLYMNNVVRPGNNMDRYLNPTQAPSLNTYGTGVFTANPTVPFNSTNFWAQGISLGLSVTY